MKSKLTFTVLLAMLVAFPAFSGNVRPAPLPTGKGAVVLATSDEWKLLAYKADTPIAVAVFQIYNPGDVGTPDSTNLSLTAFNLSSSEAKEAADKKLALLEKKEALTFPNPKGIFIQGPHGEPRDHNGWKVYSTAGLQKVHELKDQKPTEYKILEGYKELGGNAVMVHFAWPILPKNPPDFSEVNEKIFFWVIDSAKYYDKPRGAKAAK